MKACVCLFLLLFVMDTASTGSDTLEGEWGILFTTEQQGETGLFWMRPDGAHVERLFRFDDLETPLLVRPRGVLSPDGSKLAVTLADLTSPYQRFSLLDMQTRALTSLTSDDVFGKFFYWSPDSRQIAYLSDISGGRLYLIDIETRQERLISVSDDLDSLRGNSYFINMDWSPDGQTLALTYLREDRVAMIGDLTIVLINKDGSNMRRALQPHNWGLSPAWASETILYYVCRAPSERLVRLCALDVPRELSVSIRDFTALLPPQGYIKTLDAAPDGRLVFSFDDGSGRDRLYTFQLESRTLVDLTAISGIRGTNPIWFFRSAS